jgi:hypothetical protein
VRPYKRYLASFSLLTHPGPSSTGSCGPIHVSRCRSHSRYPGAAASHPSSSWPCTFHLPFKKTTYPQYLLQEIQGHRENNFQFDYGAQLLVPGPARAEAWAHNAPVRDYPPAENLGRLARRYLDHPNSEVTQVDSIVRIEPGHAHRYKVVITLEMPDAL